MRKRVSLERSITLSVLSIGLLLGTIGLLYAYWHAKTALRDTIGVTFQELARQSANNVGHLLTKEIEWIERLAGLPTIRAAARHGARVTFDASDLRRIKEEQQRYFTSMMIVDQKGQAVGDAISASTNTHYRQQPWWPVVFEEGRAWGGALSRDEMGRWYWEVAVPIREVDGNVVGALKVIFGREHLLKSVLNGRIGRTGHIMLLNEQGSVVACLLHEPTLHVRLTLNSQRESDAPLMHLSDAIWKEVAIDTHEGTEGIVGLAPVRLRSDIALQGNWALLVQQDPAEINAPLLALTERLAFFGIAAIGLVAMLRWRLARRIAQPIHALMQRMRTMDVPCEVGHGLSPTASGIEEIDALAASFNELTLRLNEAAQESRQHVRDLEEANRDLARSEEHYRMVWNHSMHLRLLVNRMGTIGDFNRRGEMKLGLPASQLVGTSVLALFRPEDQLRLKTLVEEVFDSGQERSTEEWLVPAPGGDYFVMQLDLVPIGMQGTTESVMIQLTDWTEKKQLHEQLLRSERLASLSQFASMFAHDIRNPLAGVKKTLELMGHRRELQRKPVRGWCEDLQFTIELLQGMINDMLDVYQEHYSGLPLMTSSCAVHELVQDVVRLFRPEIEARRIHMRVSLPKEEIEINADRRRLERALINLVHNAVKFSTTGGTIVISLRQEVCGLSEGGTLFLSVDDEGPGIDPGELPHIFEMFFQHYGRQDGRIGRGLGLYFCQLVVEAHHGRIHAANRPDRGAVFTVELPLGDACHADHVAHR
jgi:PAS domain S-box-containing protein